MKKYLLLLAAALVIFACNNRNKQEIYGLGATFPAPLYQKMFSEYEKQTEVNITYSAVGSGAGILQLQKGLIDFAASDIIPKDNEFKQDIVMIPTCLGAVAVAYNLPANPSLRLTPQLVAKIFLGKITTWNDPQLKKINPNIILPNHRIIVNHRSDRSGTSEIFHNFLNKTSKLWQAEQSENFVDKFIGLKATSNTAVAENIKQTPYSIGYLSSAYLSTHKLSAAAIKNASGDFVKPTPSSITKAAENITASEITSYITNSKQGYPISSFTWLLVPSNLHKYRPQKASQMINLFHWMITEGQSYAKQLQYAPLPQQIIPELKKKLNKIGE
ncbi:MAG: phosphate transport system substrate-binding protein [Candidatus Cloacimonadota bacterium]|nr:phosphate transport system substrate-binding protein [Candidatus Cloacimonadota bacterium]